MNYSTERARIKRDLRRALGALPPVFKGRKTRPLIERVREAELRRLYPDGDIPLAMVLIKSWVFLPEYRAAVRAPGACCYDFEGRECGPVSAAQLRGAAAVDEREKNFHYGARPTWPKI